MVKTSQFITVYEWFYRNESDPKLSFANA